MTDGPRIFVRKIDILANLNYDTYLWIQDRMHNMFHKTDLPSELVLTKIILFTENNDNHVNYYLATFFLALHLDSLIFHELFSWELLY